METYLTGRDPAAGQKNTTRTWRIPEGVKTAGLAVLIVAVGYLVYDTYQFRQQNRAELLRMSEQLELLEGRQEQTVSNLKSQISEAHNEVGSTRAELLKAAQRIQAEGQRTKTELSHALSTKADTAQLQSEVQAARADAENRIGAVSGEVGGVKADVGTVKEDLAGTRRDLEGTQRQIVDVRESLTAAVAKNSSEISQLRRKGERDYFEFEIPRKNQLTKVEDIGVVLTKTDPKKGKFSVQIIADDSRLEKKDRTINEPMQFLVGRNKVRYELVVNWVQKNRVGGYLSIPKDKALSSERAGN
jgi:chromosome segregation ATPase